MPLVDKPLSDLKTYQGINPRPDDFEAFWNDALEEMRATPPSIKLVPAKLQLPAAECFDLTWDGVRGARLHAKYLRPSHIRSPRPCIILFHGYSGSSGDWADKFSHIAHGFSVIAVDVRGQAGESDGGGTSKGKVQAGLITRGLSQGPHELIFRHAFLDAAQIARIAMELPHVDPNRIISFGASQGGALAIACAALEPRVFATVSLYPFLSDYLRVWNMDLAENAYDCLRRWFRENDPRHEREAWFFEQLGYIDIQNLAPRVRGSVLMGTGLMDKVCPPSTQFATYNKLACPKRMIIFPDFAHEAIPGWNDSAMLFLNEVLGGKSS
ncbi:alpha/beta fold hydrolase [Candidatus Sumerlaeota bacterium]|nr:alpha/beta fold hydrolase [Candidatus Sumerlaeota bacterium]